MAEADKHIEPQRSLTLDLPPSCLEFSPICPSHFLVGTYNLQSSEGEDRESSNGPQKRNGSIVVFELVAKDVVPVHTEQRPSAILDLRFQTCPGKQDIVGVVSSRSTLELFRFPGATPESPRLTLLGTFRIPGIEEDVLFLQFAWHPTIPDMAAITTSQGGVHMLQVRPDYMVSQATQHPIMTHSLETWCVAVSPPVPAPERCKDGSSPFTIYTGGDDSVLQYATCSIARVSSADDGPLEVDLLYAPMKVRGHNAGVTAILPLPCRKDIVVTGSYDDHIRVYSIKPLHETCGLRKVKLLAEADLGGGVWRLRMVHHEDDSQGGGGGGWRALILASCMHAGATILRVQGSNNDDGNTELKVLGRFEEHKSMNYASDFQPGSGELYNDRELVCVSTSFYDRLLCLWSIKLGR